MYGQAICDEYCVENHIENNKHFCVRVDCKLVMFVRTDLPVRKVGKFGEGTYNICEAEVDADWIDSCYKLFCEETELTNKKKLLMEAKPNVKTACDLFDELQVLGIEQFKKGNFQDALDIFVKSVVDHPTNPIVGNPTYNIACCHSMMENYDLAIEWLNKASDTGYNDWSNTIVDFDFGKCKNLPEFVLVIEKMMRLKYQDYCCREVEAYLITHNLYNFYQKLQKDYENGIVWHVWQ